MPNPHAPIPPRTVERTLSVERRNPRARRDLGPVKKSEKRPGGALCGRLANPLIGEIYGPACPRERL
ncbi:unnamed protein product, partial [Iphiclides podalirius]